MPQEPTVGNVLGVALLCRDRKALLSLDQRTLSEGLRLHGYEAEVHGIEFPMRVPSSPAALRHRRSDAIAIELEVDLGRIERWLQQRLEGARLGELTVTTASFAWDASLGPGVQAPALTLVCHSPTEPWIWIRVGLSVQSRGRRLHVAPSCCWWFGRQHQNTAELWSALTGACGQTDTTQLDPLRLTLHRALVTAGWKAPRLDRLSLQELTEHHGALRMRFAVGEPPPVVCGPANPGTLAATVQADASAVRLAMRQGAVTLALRQASRMAERLDTLPGAQAAAWRWIAALGRHRSRTDPEVGTLVANALARWRERCPHDAIAQQQRFEQTATAGARLSLTDTLRELPSHPRTRLAIAASALFEAETAGETPDDVHEQIRTDLLRLRGEIDASPVLHALRSDTAALLAVASARTPASARMFLTEAVEAGHPEPALALRLGHAMLRAQRPDEALELFSDALGSAPRDGTLWVAVEAAARATSDPQAALTRILPLVEPLPADAPAALLRTVARLSFEAKRPNALESILRALEHDADDPTFLAAAAELQHGRGEHEAAVHSWTRLRAVQQDDDAVAVTRLREAAARDALGEDAEAVWAVLWPGLASLPRGLQSDGFALAVELAPASDVEAWVRRLRARVPLALTIRALHRRWLRYRRPDAGTTVLFEALTHAGAAPEALALCEEVAAAVEGPQRAFWLTRAAAHVQGPQRANFLADALRATPRDAPLAERLMELLEESEERGRLVELLGERAEDPRLDLRTRLAAADQVLTRSIDGASAEVAAREPQTIEHARVRMLLQDTSADARLILAAAAANQDNWSEAVTHWTRALELLGPLDSRGALPAYNVGLAAIQAGDPTAAIGWFQRSKNAGFERVELVAALAAAAHEVGDAPLEVHALETQLAWSTDTQARDALHLELARACLRATDTSAALRWLDGAHGRSPAGSAGRLELAELWLEVVRGGSLGIDEEVHARSQLRMTMGDALPIGELRDEIDLLLRAPGQQTAAAALLEDALQAEPTDEALLASLHALALGVQQPDRYLDALQRAADHATTPALRDVLLERLVTAAAQADDAERCLRVLDGMELKLARSGAMLDLRDWAVGALGRQDEELQVVGERLRASPDDPLALERLTRITAGEPGAIAEALLAWATPYQEGCSRALTLRGLSFAEQADDGPALRHALRRAFEVAADSRVVRSTWETAFEAALYAEDTSGCADLLALLLRSHLAQGTDPAALDPHLQRALQRFPSAEHLHQLLAERYDSRSAAREHVEELARRSSAEHQAALFVGLASQLDHADAVAMLVEQARAQRGDAGALRTFAEALAARGQLSEQLTVLEWAVDHAQDDAERVAVLKQLAHVAGDQLGDGTRARLHLERAAALAPADPDLLLPLLDHAFEETSLEDLLRRAEQVFEHVEIGDAACISLAHRVADAALARGDLAAALRFVEVAFARDPLHAKTEARLKELRSEANDPARRVVLLEQVAGRQRGEARFDALEERARLLDAPLKQPRAAIAVLQTVLREAPDRTQAHDRLVELLEREEDWRALAEGLEQHAPQVYGPERAVLLQRIADISRTKLLDLRRAEQALRIAIDHLGGDDPGLTESLRAELVRDLESQGRYVDLAIYLERTLDAELHGAPSTPVGEARGVLLVELARIYRGPLDDEAKAARVYERLEQLGRLPDEGLATLARTYQRSGRHEDLVRILTVRFDALQNEPQRQAAVAVRVAPLLESPLGRPAEAAQFYLHAYLADPAAHTEAGKKARVLLSGTDAIANVRTRLTQRLQTVSAPHRPALLTLLGDLLCVHDEHEEEAETHYRNALSEAPEHPVASEALGRLLARQGRLEEAALPLTVASRHPGLSAQTAADAAAVAARILLELDRGSEAESVLKDALRRAPESQRALLELGRLYERSGRATEQAIVLENLSALPLSSMLGAEVAYRRASLLLPAATADAYSSEAERARAYLLEAVSADAKHVAARQALMSLARARLEWSVVAHMHYLAIRELPAGSGRAAHHLDLAETYIDHLDDEESAIRNIESAITQAPDDLVVSTRAAALTSRMPHPGRLADRLEKIASGAPHLDDAARARLWLMAAELRMSDDDVVAAEAATQQVLDLPEATTDVTAAAQRTLEALEGDERFELRKQKSGLLKLLDVEQQAPERIHILGRLREVGRAMGDPSLVEWASEAQLELAGGLHGDDPEVTVASEALRDAYAERGAYGEIVALYEQIAERSEGAAKGAAHLEAARFSWTALRDGARALEHLRASVELAPNSADAMSLVLELSSQPAGAAVATEIYEHLRHHPLADRAPELDVQLAGLAMDLGRDEDAVALLRPICLNPELVLRDPQLRALALRRLDAVLARGGSPSDRLPIVRRLFETAWETRDPELPEIALALAATEHSLGGHQRAAQVIGQALDRDPNHQGLLAARADALSEVGDYEGLAKVRAHQAALCSDPLQQAALWQEAAEAYLHAREATDRPASGSNGLDQARAALRRAIEIAPGALGPKLRLLPLSFAGSRWEEVLDLAVEIRAHESDDEEVLVLAAMTEAFQHGQRSMARDIGFRHGPDTQDHTLFPGLRQLLTNVAKDGPLPRLDALLAASSAMVGGRVALARDLRHWAAGRSLQPGLALGLARLAEAEGRADRARYLYQVAAFMVPDGPVPSLVSRLPLPAPPDAEELLASGPFEGGGLLRRVLLRTRESLNGVGPVLPAQELPSARAVRARLALCESIVRPWRDALGVAMPLRWVHGQVPGGVGVNNSEAPAIILSRGIAECSVAELRFRLARAATVIASGLSAAETTEGCTYGELLDGLARLVSSAHTPTGRGARAIADAVADLPTAPLDNRERSQLGQELSHWLGSEGGLGRLETGLRRAGLLFATRLCGQLDGALLALAHDRGFVTDGRPDPVATLRDEDAHWLLRAVNMY